ncbi:MAG: T9SS type A sorting domain-containing protein [Candidatus Azobacteroides sp.]|nr:T9SS type A sorting domain-containing protein [Candidatus Azobacteroides sp.]
MKRTLLFLFALLMSAGFSFAQTELTFEDGKVELSQFDGYPDDAVVTINITVTNEGGWGPGYGVGRLVDYAFVKDNTPFATGITVKAASEEGTINAYQFTVAELKAMASISPDKLEDLKEASAKVYGEDWTVNEDNYIVDADGNIGIAINVWGTGTLTSITIQPAPPAYVLDFDSDEVGQEYPTISINDDASPEDITAVIEKRPGGEGNALHVINGKWNTYPQFSVTLPEGYTLADVESISFELYFESVASADGQQPNSYKEFRYFFGPEGTTFTVAGKSAGQIVGNPSDNPAQTWLKKDFVPVIDDETLLPLNKFDFGLGLHINEAGNYYLDNITFVLKEAKGGGGDEEPGNITFDFEDNELGDTYAVAETANAEVVANPAPTDTNAQSLYYQNSSYDQVISLGTVELPQGYTLADCESISFDVYTAGTEYKELLIKIGDDPLWGTGEYKTVSNGGEWGTVSVNLLTGVSTYADGIEYPKSGSKGGTSVYTDGSLTSFDLAVGVNDNALAYYLDNVVLKLKSLTGITQFKPALSNVYNIDGGIIVNAANESVSIYGIDGRLVKQTIANNNTPISLSRGIYIVKVGDAKPVKVLVK